MARIVETRDIPLDDIVIGLAQVRLTNPGRGISELATSIKTKGQLQPIVVCPAETPGKYEVILGQRRFLALQELGETTIRAQVLDERVDEDEAKILSLTENVMREDLSRKDKIDVSTALYKRYGTVRDVVAASGLPEKEVKQYVKYDRLRPELKQLVDDAGMEINVALRAQDAAEAGGEYNPEEAIVLAREMAGMSGAQRKRLVQEREQNPGVPVEDIIEDAKEGSKVTQIVVTLGSQAHRALQEFARDEDSNQDDAAADLISEGLTTRGYNV